MSESKPGIPRDRIEALLAEVEATEGVTMPLGIVDALAHLFASDLDTPGDGQWDEWQVVLKCAIAFSYGRNAALRSEALAALEALRQHGHRPALQGDAGGWSLVVTGWDRETEKPFPMVVEGRDLTQMMQDAVEWCAPRRFPRGQADA